MQTTNNAHCPCHFLSVSDAIKWLRSDADLGFTVAQHRLGVLHLESASGADDLYQAYKWLFISVALGNITARSDLIEVNRRLDYEQIGKAYQLAEDWFDEKFDDDLDRDEGKWAPELIKWRFTPQLVH